MTTAAQLSYKPSRFNLLAWDRTDSHAGVLLVYNSFTSSFLQFRQPSADAVADLLGGRAVALDPELTGVLAAQGVLVEEHVDELALVELTQELYRSQHDALNLILMPTEKCFFRCVYCYEEFLKGKMSQGVRQGILRLVEDQSARLTRLKVDWFGGEPLSALDVVQELSEGLIDIADRAGFRYAASMTTNAYLLDQRRAALCLALGINRFQVTLDGPSGTHDRLRVLRNGRGTFDTIIGNLMALRRLDADYRVRIRVNFTPDVGREMPSFLRFLGDRFGNDPRFSVWFHPVGHWGGPHDEEVEVCDERTGEEHVLDFMALASEAGFSLDSWREAMQPFGSVCYAASPRSFVIGSDGNVYKCTVVFRKPENLVGHLTPDGDLHLSDELMRLWTASGEETDSGCQACAFRPACHGNGCPVERMHRGGEHACPPVKKHIKQVLPLLATRTVGR